MYDLVKQKSTGFRIVLGIIICVFITAIMKMAFYKSPTTLNDDLIKAANEINAHAPIIMDSTTRFDNVNAVSGSVFQYNYTLLTVEKSEIDTILLKTSAKQSMIEQIKQNPKAAIFKDNNIIVEARYSDKNGSYIATVSVFPNEY